MWKDRWIKAIKPRERAFRLSEDTKKRGGGRLILEVKPNGAKYFFFQYFRKQNGKSKRVLVTIGRFKESNREPGMSLADARDKGSEFESLRKKGIDIKSDCGSHLVPAQKRHTDRLPSSHYHRIDNQRKSSYENGCCQYR